MCSGKVKKKLKLPASTCLASLVRKYLFYYLRCSIGNNFLSFFLSAIMPHPLVTFITHWCCLSKKLVAKNQSCPAKTICSGFPFVSSVATSLKRWWWMFCVHWVWVFSTKTRKTKLTLSERLRKLPSHSETITHSPSQICHLEWTGALAYETPSYGLSKGTVKVRQQ